MFHGTRYSSGSPSDRFHVNCTCAGVISGRGSVCTGRRLVRGPSSCRRITLRGKIYQLVLSNELCVGHWTWERSRSHAQV